MKLSWRRTPADVPTLNTTVQRVTRTKCLSVRKCFCSSMFGGKMPQNWGFGERHAQLTLESELCCLGFQTDSKPALFVHSNLLRRWEGNVHARRSSA
jgi:hypothetical protein